ncbi:MAG TPA: FG-GAP-like repeat-containing protein [Bryobacteraceae bacterium]
MAGTVSSFPPQTCRSLITAALLLILTSCGSHKGVHETIPPEYTNFVRHFYIGLAGLQTGADDVARQNLTQATQFAPGEPAAFANLAILALRQQDYETAFKNADHARQLFPDHDFFENLLGDIESKRGNSAAAIAHYKKAVAAYADNVKARYSLAEETERQAGPNSDAEAEKLFAQVLAKRPNNIAVQIQVARLGAKTGNNADLQNAVFRLAAESATWPDDAKQQMTAIQQALSSGTPRTAAVRLVFLRNVLIRVDAYRHDLNEVKTPAELVAQPFTSFFRLSLPPFKLSPPDTALKFDAATPPPAPPNVTWAGAIAFDDSGKFTPVWANDSALQIAGGAKLPFPGGPAGPNAVLGIDLNYDYKTDLVLAGTKGIHVFEQKDLSDFTDVTAKAKLPPAIANGSYTGAWAFDVDLDGDLDIVLGSAAGANVLRNNADGTFKILTPFPGVNGIKAFASADIDNDGDPDVAMIDASGKLHIFMNDRLGQYRERALPSTFSGSFDAVLAADATAHGSLDFVGLRNDGAIVCLSDNQGSGWFTADLAKATSPHAPSLLAADLDNNGRLDLITGDGQIFLGGKENFTPLAFKASVTSAAVVDTNGDGKLDLVGVSPTGGEPVLLINHSTKNYHWQDIRVRAATTKGDQRINSFGIGGSVDLWATFLFQKQPITSPLIHFGTGDEARADVARIIWPNGVAQAEFDLKTEQQILAIQRLKGSCPWLFAWDGKQMSFVKDGSPWSSALGLHINAQNVAGIGQTQEWFKIPGESLKPHDGYYDLRITAELWETYYIDHYSLMVVDHPAGTEVYSDERFAVPAPPLKLFTTAEPHPFASAHDDHGNDVSAIVKDLDRNYLDTFGRGPYQGLTSDHYVELELPANAPHNGPLYLLGGSWLHPTDGTVNIAIGQNSIPQPQSLSIEVPDAHGNWKVARKNLGFPAGKMKTVVFDLDGIFLPGAPRKLRLCTNLEIYWDQLQWATGAPDSQNRIQRISLTSADLRYRGYSEVKAANPSSPELPDYNHIASTGPMWRDLVGFTTRHGDVRELLQNIDDRIIIMSAGDELRLRFPEQPPPPAGWKRDYIMIGDGWIKDGDYNTVFSKTVLPIPYHAMKDYAKKPGRLEDDPAYKLHPADWQNYHTRYISADLFENALRN